MDSQELMELNQIVAVLNQNWTVTTTFDPSADFGRGKWVAAVYESAGNSAVEFVIAKAEAKLPLDAAIFAVEDAIAKAGGAKFV